MEAEGDEISKAELMEDKNYGLILPDNARVQEKLRSRAEEEAKIKQQETLRKQRMDDITNKKNMKLKKEEEERERRRIEMENAQLNYEKFEESVRNGDGNLNEIFSTILRNTSAYELAFPNYNMEDGWDFRLLTTILERNTSLLTLSLSRKNLGDVEGKKLAEMISKNKKLRRLELEGNFFGPETAAAFASALEKNNTLRYLDLENNNLTNNGQNLEGMKKLFESLKNNTMLISLNIANNCLTGNLGSSIVDMLRFNKNIINLEFFQNKDFILRPPNEKNSSVPDAQDLSKFKSIGLSIEQIDEIKKLLKRNNDAYQKMRTDEWKERKRMTNNYQDNVDTQIIVEAQKTLEETRKKEKEDIEKLYLDNFNDSVKTMEEEFNQKVNEFFAETKARLEKKKPKKKKKKK